MYVMQVFLQEARLRQKGIYNFDAWASSFGEVTTALELTPEGTGYRMRTRFDKFVNLPELMQMFREVADIILPEMLDIKKTKLKGGKYIIVESEASEYVRARMEDMVARAEDIHNGRVDSKDDNMLKPDRFFGYRDARPQKAFHRIRLYQAGTDVKRDSGRRDLLHSRRQNR